MNNKNYLVIIFGPTGVGKTNLSIDIAKYYNSEIFSCDSRQFYKELKIGVAKPSKEQLNTVKHHFISNVSILEHYSISKFETEAIAKLDEYYKKNNIALMVGGSGLYINAILNGVDTMPDHDEKIRQEVTKLYEEQGLEAIRFELKRIDPVYYNQVDLKNPLRILRAIEIYRQTGKPFSDFRKNKKTKRNFEIIKVGINLDREVLYENINKRVDNMFQEGLLEEVKNISIYQDKNLVALKTIGYTELFEYLKNEQNKDKTVELIKRNTRRYARRQLTWFRKYEDAKWFYPNDYKKVIEYINLKIK